MNAQQRRKKERQTVTLDVECYRNYFLIKFRNNATGNLVSVPMYEGMPLDVDLVRKILRQYRIITFNGNNYDMIMVTLALTGRNCSELKDASDLIIKSNLKSWHIERRYGIVVPKNIDHIDIIEVAPGIASLKTYSGRLHCKKMQDLPLHPDTVLSEIDMVDIDDYCGNDLSNTGSLFDALKEQIELRERMSETYGVDLRSKSDAQIAETVIKNAIEELRGERVFKPDIAPGTTYCYHRPEFITFQTKRLQDILQTVCDNEYILADTGKIALPKSLSEAEIRIGNSVYRMGIGGLHSSEVSVSHFSDEDGELIDSDADSFYPKIITNLKLYPPHLGREFLKIYGPILTTRLHAKSVGDKVTDSTFKIILNGSFGKFGSKYSILFAPQLLIQTTLTGQLLLLMLIETLELNGIPVVSANTDGVVSKVPTNKKQVYDDIIRDWELQTDLTMSKTKYKSLHSRDVNNYIAVKEDGKYKCKGEFAPTGLQKNPQNEICSNAVSLLLTKQIPVEKTIKECADIRKFVTVRNVTGGGVWSRGTKPNPKPTIKEMKSVIAAHGWELAAFNLYSKDDGIQLALPDAYRRCFKVTSETYLGKAIRWYYAKGVQGAIYYKLNGKKVPRSDNSKPIMDLPDEFPNDINYDWYIDEAYSMLNDMGVPLSVQQPEFADLL